MDNQKLSIKPKTGYGFIYCYTSPSGKKYIGKTKTSLKTRTEHNARGYKGCPAFYNAIQKYGWDNFEVEILEELPLDILDEVESQYIIDLDTINPEKGYNIVTDAQKYLAVFNRIRVYCYNGETGEYIGTYESMAEAERQIGVYPGSVRRVVNKPYNTVRGMLWRTEKFEQVPVLPRGIQSSSKHVYQYDIKTGLCIAEFNSIREAARTTGFDRKTISDQVANKAIKHTKYFFSKDKVDNIYDESSTTIRNGVGSSEPKRK